MAKHVSEQSGLQFVVLPACRCKRRCKCPKSQLPEIFKLIRAWRKRWSSRLNDIAALDMMLFERKPRSIPKRLRPAALGIFVLYMGHSNPAISMAADKGLGHHFKVDDVIPRSWIALMLETREFYAFVNGDTLDNIFDIAKSLLKDAGVPIVVRFGIIMCMRFVAGDGSDRSSVPKALAVLEWDRGENPLGQTFPKWD